VFVLAVLQEVASFDKFASLALLTAGPLAVPALVAEIAARADLVVAALRMAVLAHQVDPVDLVALRTLAAAARAGLRIVAGAVQVVPQELLVAAHTAAAAAVAPQAVPVVVRTEAAVLAAAQAGTELALAAGGAYRAVLAELLVQFPLGCTAW